MSKVEEHEALLQAAEAREAGVADLLSFYVRVEEVYGAASKALAEHPNAYTTNAANPHPQR